MNQDLLEIPIVSATALDSTLSGGKSKAGIQKLRQHLRGIVGEGHLLSVGDYGTVSINNYALLTCLETGFCWGPTQRDRLTMAFKRAGLTKLVKSKLYRDAMVRAVEAIQGAANSQYSGRVSMVANVVGALVIRDATVRDVADEMHTINVAVDDELEEVKRLPGQLVRHEGHEAVIVLNTGEREELRAVDASYLQATGIEKPGDPFVLQQLKWSADRTASVYLPAVDPEEATISDAHRAKLERAESPLPRPH
jgi:hypothetical protein